MTPLRRIVPAVILVAFAVAFAPGLCTADCAANMDCCPKAPAPRTTLDSDSCCKAERPHVTVPSTLVAVAGSKIARDATAPAPFLFDDAIAAAHAGFEQPAPDPSPPHRARGVPLYLLNTSILR
jgi:cell division septation protein DedD